MGREILAFEELHCQKGQTACGDSMAQNVGDMRALDVGRDFGFALKSMQLRRMASKRFAQHLHCNVLIQL
jgi:hypothetical protein